MAPTVRIRGLTETIAALKEVDAKAAKDLKKAVKKASEPVADLTKSKLSRFQGVSMNVAPRIRGSSVFVRQNARKVTGKRGDFGATQMRVAFLPAAAEKENEVRDGVEDALDRWVRDAGF